MSSKRIRAQTRIVGSPSPSTSSDSTPHFSGTLPCSTTHSATAANGRSSRLVSAKPSTSRPLDVSSDEDCGVFLHDRFASYLKILVITHEVKRSASSSASKVETSGLSRDAELESGGSITSHVDDAREHLMPRNTANTHPLWERLSVASTSIKRKQILPRAYCYQSQFLARKQPATKKRCIHAPDTPSILTFFKPIHQRSNNADTDCILLSPGTENNETIAPQQSGNANCRVVAMFARPNASIDSAGHSQLQSTTTVASTSNNS